MAKATYAKNFRLFRAFCVRKRKKKRIYLLSLLCSLALVINIPKILKFCGYLFEHR